MLFKLESWRGIAAIIIVLYHSSFTVFDNNPLMKNSFLFVDLFFILSGFVMALSYSEKITNGLNFKNYILLRLARLYPLHFFTLIVWLIYLLAKQYLFIQGYGGSSQFNESSNENIYSFLTHLTLTQSMWLNEQVSWNMPSWSISTEFFAYIFFFFIHKLCKPSRYIVICIAISLLAYLSIYFIVGSNHLGLTADGGFIRCLGAFYIGVLIYKSKIHQFKPIGKHINICEFLVIILLITVLFFADNFINQLITVLCMGLIIMVFANKNNGVIGSILESKALKTIGKWSYSIYMTHSIINSVIEVFITNLFPQAYNHFSTSTNVAINLFILITTIYTSKYTYIYIEEFFKNKFKNRINSHSSLKISYTN